MGTAVNTIYFIIAHLLITVNKRTYGLVGKVKVRAVCAAGRQLDHHDALFKSSCLQFEKGLKSQNNSHREEIILLSFFLTTFCYDYFFTIRCCRSLLILLSVGHVKLSGGGY